MSEDEDELHQHREQIRRLLGQDVETDIRRAIEKAMLEEVRELSELFDAKERFDSKNKIRRRLNRLDMKDPCYSESVQQMIRSLGEDRKTAQAEGQTLEKTTASSQMRLRILGALWKEVTGEDWLPSRARDASRGSEPLATR